MRFNALFISLITGCALLSSGAVLANSATPQSGQVNTVVEQVSSDKVNINSASASELQKALIGIGAKKAEAIVQYREAHGIFTAVEQLLEVQGIGKATLEKNKDRIIL